MEMTVLGRLLEAKERLLGISANHIEHFRGSFLHCITWHTGRLFVTIWISVIYLLQLWFIHATKIVLLQSLT